MSEKVLDISEVKPGDEFVHHTDVFVYDDKKGGLPGAPLYRVITVGEEMVFMGVNEGPYYREALISHGQIEKGTYVRYKRPKIEKVKRFLVKDEGGFIRWYVDHPKRDETMLGAIEVTVINDKITKVEIADV